MDGRPVLTPEERRARLQLFLTPGLGPRRIEGLLGGAGSGAGVVACRDQLPFPGLDLRAAALEMEARCEARGVEILCPGFQGFPLALEEMDPPPPVLFSTGSLAADRPRRVAIVGARKASAYGRRVARRLGRELAEEGCTVISGMALGVDGEAHTGALEAGGVTLAVLGSGPDRAYPAVHRALHRQIARSGGILSEHPPGTGALPHHFPRRNRILACLAEAVIVVEAAERSGALITAGASPSATVFAVPGSVESPLSRGTFALLRDGAAPLSSAEDLLEVMGWPSLRPEGVAVASPLDLGKVEGAIWQCLGPSPVSLEEVVLRVGSPPVRVLSALGVLEVGGWAQQVPGGRYVRGAGSRGGGASLRPGFTTPSSTGGP